MNQMFPYHLLACQLRETSYVGWIHATGVGGLSGGKAGFYAIGAILGRVTDKHSWQ